VFEYLTYNISEFSKSEKGKSPLDELDRVLARVHQILVFDKAHPDYVYETPEEFKRPSDERQPAVDLNEVLKDKDL
jgi:hypothetical protein